MTDDDLVAVLPPQGIVGTEISIDMVVYHGNHVDGFIIPRRHVARLQKLGWTLKTPFDLSAITAEIQAIEVMIQTQLKVALGG